MTMFSSGGRRRFLSGERKRTKMFICLLASRFFSLGTMMLLFHKKYCFFFTFHFQDALHVSFSGCAFLFTTLVYFSRRSSFVRHRLPCQLFQVLTASNQYFTKKSATHFMSVQCHKKSPLNHQRHRLDYQQSTATRVCQILSQLSQQQLAASFKKLSL